MSRPIVQAALIQESPQSLNANKRYQIYVATAAASTQHANDSSRLPDVARFWKSISAFIIRTSGLAIRFFQNTTHAISPRFSIEATAVCFGNSLRRSIDLLQAGNSRR